MADSDWRIIEVLKLIRQCVVCPYCGSLVATDAGIETHKAWHVALTNKVNQIDNNFTLIDEYVRGDGGMEDKITTAFANTNGSVVQLRTDATNAIVVLQNRVTTLENAA